MYIHEESWGWPGTRRWVLKNRDEFVEDSGDDAENPILGLPKTYLELDRLGRGIVFYSSSVKLDGAYETEEWKLAKADDSTPNTHTTGVFGRL